MGQNNFDNSVTCGHQMLHSLRGADVDLRGQYGKCFGVLGAIDPGKQVQISPSPNMHDSIPLL